MTPEISKRYEKLILFSVLAAAETALSGKEQENPNLWTPGQTRTAPSHDTIFSSCSLCVGTMFNRWQGDLPLLTCRTIRRCHPEPSPAALGGESRGHKARGGFGSTVSVMRRRTR